MQAPKLSPTPSFIARRRASLDGRHAATLASLLIAFLVWGAIFFAQAANSVDWLWIMLTMFFVGFPVSAWVARKATGVDPYRLLFP